jgi:acetolactate synthase-1/2/3 large subunit
MNLVHALAEARASGVAVLALVGEPPLELQGKGAFQDTSGRDGAIDALAVFRAVSVWCERAAGADGVPAQLERAIDAALGRRGPAVLLLEKNVQCAELAPAASSPAPLGGGVLSGDAGGPCDVPSAALADAACRLATGKVLVIAGEQVAREGGTDALARLVDRLDARVAVTPDGRDAFDNANACFVGVAGAMGHATAARALEQAAVCLLVGTRLPLLARQGLEPLLGATTLISLGRGRPFVEPVALHLEGSARGLCDALADELPARTRREPLPRTALDVADQSSSERARADVLGGAGPIDMAGALARVARALPEGAVVLADAGNTGASVAHYLDLPRGGRSLIAMGMAGMGYSFGAAIGAACASGQRCVVCAGDGAFFMHGMEVHTAVEHALPITFIIFNNRAHGMCLMRERLLIGEEHRYNTFKEAHIGAACAALFPTLPSRDCRCLDELEQALSATATVAGPALIALELPGVEVPPFAALRAAAERLARARAEETP